MIMLLCSCLTFFIKKKHIISPFKEPVFFYCEKVEHVIVYNAAADAQQVSNMMSEGRRVLSAIPGVRRVITGEAVKQDATYRYSWLIEFCNASVIDSYRQHPDHLAFADKLFRPLAGDRISIDYRSVEHEQNHAEAGNNVQRKSA